MKIYLINPRCRESFWGFQYVNKIAGMRYSMGNLALPTIAALTPPEHEIEIVDENIEPINFDKDCDLVGITAFTIQVDRAKEIADEFRNRGKLVAIGGSNASLYPDEMAPHADILFIGEAENTWPQFLKDFKNREWKKVYREENKIDITQSPMPRWELMPVKHYGKVSVQTTRGCPFDCDFCDVIMYLGRKVRHKTTEQVITEIKNIFPLLDKYGRDSIFFADDNFIGNPPFAKELLREIIKLNSELPRPIQYSTQVSINLARDKELLDLMAEAGFNTVFIGVETPRASSLAEANKHNNLRDDLLKNIHTIQKHGIIVWAGMIVGFDNDDDTIFQEHLNFLADAGIPISMTGMLSAPVGTRLWKRLKEEGRIIDVHYEDQATTNVLPKQMSTEVLRAKYVQLMKDLYSFDWAGKRIKKMVDLLGTAYVSNENEMSETCKSGNYWGEQFKDARLLITRFRQLNRVFWHYMKSGKEHRKFFFELVRYTYKTNPAYMKETFWNLAVLKHFQEFSRRLAERYPS